MNSTTNSSFTKSIAENPLLWSALALAFWIAGALSGSIALMVASGILAYGRPLLYNTLINNEEKTEKTAKTGFNGLSSIRPSAVGIR